MVGRGQRRHRRRAHPLPHARRAGDDRHRRPRAGGAAPQPRQGGLPARAARPGAGGLHQPGDQGARRARGRRRRRRPARGRAGSAEPRRARASTPDRATAKKVEILQSYAQPAADREAAQADHPLPRLARGAARRTTAGEVTAITLVRNELVRDADGHAAAARHRAVRGRCRSGSCSAPSATAACRCPACPSTTSGASSSTRRGACSTRTASSRCVGEYTAGWIKRGPSGVIGTNKPDAAETVAVHDGGPRGRRHPRAARAERRGGGCARALAPAAVPVVRRLARARPPGDRAGAGRGRPRVKLTRLEEIAAALRDHGGGNR